MCAFEVPSPDAVAAPLADAGPILDALRGVRWPARRPLAAGPPGAHRSRRRSTAFEFTEYRAYRQGDDPRRLDWKLLARTDRAFVRITDDHALWPTTLVVDGSASMAFPAPSEAKWRLARLIALGLASVAHAGGDPVALIVAAGEDVVRIPPTTRRDTVVALARALATVRLGGAAQLVARLTGPAGPPRGRVVIISDFLDPETPALVRAARTSDAELHAVHIIAREEIDPPAGARLVSDPEDPGIRRPLTRHTRPAYDAAFAAWRDELQRMWVTAGASYTIATTGEPVDRLVRRITQHPSDRATTAGP